LGTDGFGRSDTRATLRKHFEVDRYHIAYSAIKALVEDGQLASAYTKKAWEKYIGNVQQQDPTFI
jgi:pyruvate dehydrogenase E1 component